MNLDVEGSMPNKLLAYEKVLTRSESQRRGAKPIVRDNRSFPCLTVHDPSNLQPLYVPLPLVHAECPQSLREGQSHSTRFMISVAKSSKIPAAYMSMSHMVSPGNISSSNQANILWQGGTGSASCRSARSQKQRAGRTSSGAERR